MSYSRLAGSEADEMLLSLEIFKITYVLDQTSEFLQRSEMYSVNIVVS